MDKKSYKAEVSIQDTKIKSLKDQMHNLRARLEQAEKFVQAANQKVSKMAQSALRT
jgi:multidrug resistance efflux pump